MPCYERRSRQPPGDVSGLAEALRCLFEDQDLRWKLETQGSACLSQMRSWDHANLAGLGNGGNGFVGSNRQVEGNISHAAVPLSIVAL